MTTKKTSPKVSGARAVGNVWLTAKEASEYLGVAIRTLYKMIQRRAIPCYKPNGGKVLFKLSELDAFMEQGRRKSLPEISQLADEYEATRLQTL